MKRMKQQAPLIWALSWGCVGALEQEAHGMWRCMMASTDPAVRSMLFNIQRQADLLAQGKGSQTLADQFCDRIFLPKLLVDCLERLWHANLCNRQFATKMEEYLFSNMGKDGKLKVLYTEPTLLNKSATITLKPDKEIQENVHV